jgi:hypothetical protein
MIRQFTEADLPDLIKNARQEHILSWCPDWNNCADWAHDWFRGIEWRYTVAGPNKEFILLAMAIILLPPLSRTSGAGVASFFVRSTRIQTATLQDSRRVAVC